ncbi:MAG: ATP-grasp fold amidoligase family protein [Bacteroidia bacterium]
MNLSDLKYKGLLGYGIYLFIYKFYRWIKYDRYGDEKFLKKRFEQLQGYPLNLDSPKTLNEKINWLKLNFSHPDEHILADKFAVRDYIAKVLGEKYLIPLVFSTTNHKEINPTNIPDFPVIVKANHDSGSYKIIRNKSKIDWKRLQTDCKFWLSRNYYWIEREPQYKKIKPRIIVEKLLISNDGKIPFDYKLHCINGIVEFIYVSVDREGANKRNIYSRNWEPLLFTWANKSKDFTKLRGPEIPKPDSMDEMIKLAEVLAKGFPYVRIDFYDVDGNIFFGEITQHHGGGFDQIRPIEWDYKFGKILNLPLSKEFV